MVLAIANTRKRLQTIAKAVIVRLLLVASIKHWEVDRFEMKVKGKKLNDGSINDDGQKKA